VFPVGLVSAEFPVTGDFEALGRPAVVFHFWHWLPPDMVYFFLGLWRIIVIVFPSIDASFSISIS